jgi:hypothetical protein
MTDLGYTWRIAGREIAGGKCSEGSGVADCVDAVAEGVDGALRRHYMPDGPEVLAQVLYAVWGPLRHSMVTDGTLATREKGGSWQGSNGPVSVRIWAL